MRTWRAGLGEVLGYSRCSQPIGQICLLRTSRIRLQPRPDLAVGDFLGDLLAHQLDSLLHQGILVSLSVLVYKL